MIDELEELRRTDPVDVGSLDAAVALDRTELLELLEADAGRRRARLRLVGGPRDRSANRAGYVAAMAAAAAIVVGFVVIGSDGGEADIDVIAPAEGDPAPLTDEDQNDQDQGDESAADPEPPNVVVSVDGETDPTVASSTTTATTAAPSTTSTLGAVGAAPATAVVDEGAFDPTVDLVSLHFDHAHLDDGQATVAAREISTRFGLEPHVVSGTRSLVSGGQVHDLEPVMEAAWGDDWINARVERSAAVERTADRWLAAIDGGGRVWVAEGGVSDFTAEVVRELRARRPELDTVGKVHIVQHALSNESGAVSDELLFVETYTTYTKIEDGNADNTTANLNQAVDGFETTALAGRHSDAWATAFEYLPASRLDFSDTVALLHILGVGTDEVGDPGEFAERFMR